MENSIAKYGMRGFSASARECWILDWIPAFAGMTVGAAVLLIAVGCSVPEVTGVRYVATIHSLFAIMEEVVGERGEVLRLVSPGASPHTFALKPSDARDAQSALALFYVDDRLDGWAVNVDSGAHVAVFPMLPADFKRSAVHDSEHGETADGNPHFWGNPIAVAAVVPGLVLKLSEYDPGGKAMYEENAARFLERLAALDVKLTKEFSEVNEGTLILFHPSWEYFLGRYDIAVAGIIETSPGKEATPRHLKMLIELASEKNVRAILTEVQVPQGPAAVLAEGAGLDVYEIDPLGGAPGRETYVELMWYNTKIIIEALQ